MSSETPRTLLDVVQLQIQNLGLIWERLDQWNASAPEDPLDVRSMFDHGQVALDLLAKATRRQSGLSPPHLGNLTWTTPGTLREGSWIDPLARRLAFIARDMDEVCSADWIGAEDQNGTEELLELAQRVFYFCSGEGVVYENDNGIPVHLPSLKHTEYRLSHVTVALRRALFNCTALVLCRLARAHSAKTERHLGRQPVYLWNQEVKSQEPSPLKTIKQPCTLSRSSKPPPGHFHATTPEQVQQWHDLHNDTLDMFRMSRDTSIELRCRINKAIGIISRAVHSQSASLPGLKTDEYRDELFNHAMLALNDIVQNAERLLHRQPSDSLVLELFQPSSDGRPKPNMSPFQDSTINEMRRWTALTLLDGMFRLPAADPARISGVLFLMGLCSGCKGEIETKVQSQVPLVDFIDFVDVPETANTFRGNMYLAEPYLPDDDAFAAWRGEMFAFVKYTILGLAQFVSASFRRDVRVWNNRVIAYDQARYCGHVREA